MKTEILANIGQLLTLNIRGNSKTLMPADKNTSEITRIITYPLNQSIINNKETATRLIQRIKGSAKKIGFLCNILEITMMKKLVINCKT